MLTTVRWALMTTWNTRPPLLLSVLGLAVARSTVVAGLALAVRGILNAIVAEAQNGPGRLAPLLPWLLVGLGFALIEVVVPPASAYAQRRLAQALELRVTTALLTHAAALSPAQCEGPEFRTLLAQARDGASRQLARLVMDLVVVVTEFIQGVLLAGVLLHIEPLALLLVVPGAALYLVAEGRAMLRHQAEAPDRALRWGWARYFTSLLTGERSANEIRLLGLAPVLVDRFRATTLQLDTDDRIRARRQLALTVAFGTLTTLVFYACLVLVASRAIAGRLTIGDVAVFAAVGSRLRSSLNRFVLAVVHVLEAMLASDGVRTFLAIPPSRPPTPPSRSAPSSMSVEVDDVWFTYPGALHPAVAGVSFHVRPGEIVALVGPNGAGKTTLLRLLAGLYQPDRGRILVDGRELQEWPFEVYRERVAMVSQDSPRFEATANDNIALGHWTTLNGAPEVVERVAARAGVDRVFRQLPRGYQTNLGRLFGEHDLSSGQWQQVAFARAEARLASLWLLDEPSAHLDERAEGELLERVRRFAREQSVVLVSHRPRVLAIADRVVTLEHGRVVTDAIRAELARELDR
jgi:ATP-binding cassette subfamily B protein